MVVSYERIFNDFLLKITEYKFLSLPQSTSNEIAGIYMRHAVMQFSTVCREPLTGFDDEKETVTMENDIDEDEFIDIITDGMVFYWFKQYMFAEENLKNQLNTADFSTYSPAELLKQVKSAYDQCRKDFTARLRRYSYDHGDLTDLYI